jgi:arginase
LIGVRSYEQGEAEFLARLNVRVYFIEEVEQRGFTTVLKEAIEHDSEHTVGYGLSLDMDAIDPQDAPAVDVPEPNGIKIEDVLKGLAEMVKDTRLIGAEMVEFDPSRDNHHMTEKLMVSFLEVIRMGINK